MIRFKDTTQLSTSYECKPHVYPKYGLSTTDPTFYEPTASRIANMKKSASAMQGIFDYKGKIDGKNQDEIRDKSLKQLESSVVDVRYSKNGLTREEISQITMEKSLEVDRLVKNKAKEKADNFVELKKELETAEAVSKVLEKKEISSGETTIQKSE